MPGMLDDPDWDLFLKGEPDVVTGVKFSEEQLELCKSGYQIMMGMYLSDITEKWESIPPPEVLEEMDKNLINTISFREYFAK